MYSALTVASPFFKKSIGGRNTKTNKDRVGGRIFEKHKCFHIVILDKSKLDHSTSRACSQAYSDHSTSRALQSGGPVGPSSYIVLGCPAHLCPSRQAPIVLCCPAHLCPSRQASMLGCVALLIYARAGRPTIWTHIRNMFSCSLARAGRPTIHLQFKANWTIWHIFICSSFRIVELFG